MILMTIRQKQRCASSQFRARRSHSSRPHHTILRSCGPWCRWVEYSSFFPSKILTGWWSSKQNKTNEMLQSYARWCRWAKRSSFILSKMSETKSNHAKCCIHTHVDASEWSIHPFFPSKISTGWWSSKQNKPNEMLQSYARWCRWAKRSSFILSKMSETKPNHTKCCIHTHIDAGGLGFDILFFSSITKNLTWWWSSNIRWCCRHAPLLIMMIMIIILTIVTPKMIIITRWCCRPVPLQPAPPRFQLLPLLSTPEPMLSTIECAKLN